MTARTFDQSPDPEDPDDDLHHAARRETGFFGRQAAGAVIVAADTGRVLLMLRSEEVLESGTWGNCGGAHHAEEEPSAAARREIREETGWAGHDADLAVVPAYEFRSGGFVYRNFVAVVPEEFEPILGWEADEHRWCDPAMLPEPLHFGMVALFADDDSLALIRGGWRHAAGPNPTP